MWGSEVRSPPPATAGSFEVGDDSMIVRLLVLSATAAAPGVGLATPSRTSDGPCLLRGLGFHLGPRPRPRPRGASWGPGRRPYAPFPIPVGRGRTAAIRSGGREIGTCPCGQRFQAASLRSAPSLLVRCGLIEAAKITT
jgi:hypothetical protein